MGLLKKNEQTIVKNRLAEGMKDPIKIVLFVSDKQEDCHYCNLTKEVIEEVANLSEGKIVTETFLMSENKELAEKYGVEYVPGFAILDKNGDNRNVVFHGAPFGHEFATLLEIILVVSNGYETPVPDSVVKKIKEIKEPVKLQAFVTPTCPHCPQAVLTSHFFAMINPNIKSEMVEASEFPELSAKYGVSAVPQVVINDGAGIFVGAYPPENFYEEIMKTLGK